MMAPTKNQIVHRYATGPESNTGASSKQARVPLKSPGFLSVRPMARTIYQGAAEAPFGGALSTTPAQPRGSAGGIEPPPPPRGRVADRVVERQETE